jgi:exosome complex exonuclease DIS3/RRP44
MKLLLQMMVRTYIFLKRYLVYIYLTVDDEEETLDDMEVDENKPEPKDLSQLIPTGRIVGIIKRNWRPYCGTIEGSRNTQSGGVVGASGSTQNVFFWPMDSRIPKIRIRTRQVNLLLGRRIIVAMDSWSRNSK